MPNPMDEAFDDIMQGMRRYPGTGKPIPELKERKAPQAEDEPADWESMGKVYISGGKEVVFFPIGALALALDRRPVTIRSWEDKGWLPKPKFRGKAMGYGRRRLYTHEQVSGVVAAAERAGILASGRIPTERFVVFKGLVDPLFNKVVKHG